MKLSGFVFAVLLAGVAQAQPEQLMLNLSASGEVSAEPAIVQVACTIVSGRVPIAVLAEAETPGTDAALVIIDVTRGEPVVVDDNDDFTSRSADDLDLLARVLRLPNQGSDALAIGIADDQAICAIAGEVSGTGGSGLINLQINDLIRVTAFAPAPDKTAVKITAVHAADAPIDAAVTAEAIEAALKRLNRR
jgi:hypothetical protein